MTKTIETEQDRDMKFLNDEELAMFTPSRAELLMKISKLRQVTFTNVGGSFNLDELIGAGPFVLDAVENNRFRLEGSVLEAIEDENDGYRSSLERLTVHEPYSLRKNIEPVLVRVEKAPADGDDDPKVQHGNYWTDFVGHRLVTKEGRLVLLIGTNNTDDYYPSFTFFYRPVGAP